MSPKIKDTQIIHYLEIHTYIETAQFFQISISAINAAIQRNNVKQKDDVFRYCDHVFSYEMILHKVGVGSYAYCKKCGLNTTGSAAELIKASPNALIVERIIKDCDEPGCQFCQ